MQKSADKKLTELANGSIPKLVLSFTSTTFAALLFNALYNLTDALFVSHAVGNNAMGGVSIVFPFIMIQGAISQTVGGGAAALVSVHLGKKEYAQAGNITFNAMMTFYITAAVTTVLGLVFLHPMLNVMGVTDEIYDYAKTYYIIILCGNVFSTGFSSIIRAEGAKLYGLLIWVIPISINIVLDAVFLFGFNMGVKGSALATVICQFTSFLMCVIYFCRFSSQSFSSIKMSKRVIGNIIGLGLPSLIQAGGLSIISLLLNNVLSHTSSTDGVTVFAYISKIIMIATVPFLAVSQALAPIVGYNYGAQQGKRVKKAVSFSFLICFIYSAVAFAAAQCVPSVFFKIFTSDFHIIDMGKNAIKIIAVSILFAYIPVICGAVLQAMECKALSFFMYCINLVILVPCVIIMSAVKGIDGIWLSIDISYALGAVIAAGVYIFAARRKWKGTI